MSAPQIAPDGQQVEAQSVPSRQLNRSCESCRSLKVRCLPDANIPNQCQRCVRAKRACVFVAPQRRRPRKRTDSRVAQLEKEMAAMRTALKDQRAIIEETLDEDNEAGTEEGSVVDKVEIGFKGTPKVQPPNYQDIQFTHTAKLSNRSPHEASQSPGYRSTSHISSDGPSSIGTPTRNLSLYSSDSGGDEDVISRGIISINTAETLVSLFVNDLISFFPFLIFPPDTTASHLRKTKPVLFLAILAASSIAVDVNLANTLNREMLGLYAHRFFFKGEKSLEMVQALLLMNIYYLPPESPAQIQLYQYSHIAATMALEIGIASKKRMPRKPNQNQRQTKPVNKFDEQMAEQARTVLTCYHLASNVAMRTRRPNILPYNDWIKECVRLLSRSPFDSDKQFATWFGLQIITDEALSSFGLDDTSSTALLSETRVNGVLRLFDKKIEEWKEEIDPEFFTVTMVFEYQYTTLVVYELGIGEGYRDPDAIKRQYYTLPAPDGESFSRRPPEPLSAIRVDLTIKWMYAAQGLLSTFLECDVHTMRKIPNLVYSRTILGIMVLLKIYFSVKSGAMGEVIRPDSIKVEDYVESVTQRLTEASGGSKYPIPSRWLLVADKARDWFKRFQKHCVDQEMQQRGQFNNNTTSSNYNEETVAPSTSTVSNTWHGGIVPLPIPVYPETKPQYANELALQQQQQQFNTGPGYSNTQENSSNAAKGAMATSAAATATASTYSDYSQTTSWTRPPLPTAAASTATSDLHATVNSYHQLSSQATWTFGPPPPPPQHLLDLQNPSFSSAMGEGSENDMYPMDMEFDWVPEHGIFQLPTF